MGVEDCMGGGSVVDEVDPVAFGIESEPCVEAGGGGVAIRMD